MTTIREAVTSDRELMVSICLQSVGTTAALTPALILLGDAADTSPAGLTETGAIEPAIDLYSGPGPSDGFKPRKLEHRMQTVGRTEGPYEIALRGG